LEVFVEPVQPRTVRQSSRDRTPGDPNDMNLMRSYGFTRSKSGNYVGSFFLAKKSSDITIMARINIFQSDRTTKPGCPWTWSIQVVEGPRNMVMEQPGYSNFYFARPHEAAINVQDDLHAGGYVPTEPRRSPVIATIAGKQAVAERVATAEDRASIRRPERTRVIDT
jgi:hypothetical protein